MVNKGDCYFVAHGNYTGKFIVMIEKIQKEYGFLMMPGTPKVVLLSEMELQKALDPNLLYKGFKDGGILTPHLDYIEKIPNEVLNILTEQFKETKKQKNNIKRDLLYRKK